MAEEATVLKEVSAVVVSFADPEAALRAVDSLLGQTAAVREVLLVDNHPDELLARRLDAEPADPRVRLLHRGANLGYTEGCNLAAAHAQGSWLFFLNPDARAEPDCVRALVAAADEGTAVVGAQVLLPDGRTNAGDNPLHVTGISWAGRYGEPAESGPARDVAAVSGAALLARASAFAQLGGLCSRFFLYQDDADLCWRARLSGWSVRFCPAAVVRHDYEFDKGNLKWFWLERNRLWSVASNYSPLSLILLSPMLAGAEAAIIALAVRDGWFALLLRAWRDVLRDRRELARWRRRVQHGRRVGDLAVLAAMTARFETPLLASPLTSRLNPLVAAYVSIVRRLLAVVRAG